MNARAPLTLLALGALAAPPAGALPAPVPHQVVAVPSGFAPSEVTILAGDTVTLLNADPLLLAHDLVSRNFGPGGVRLFGSAPVATGERADVAGVARLAPGVYPFYCSLHESMIGNLRVQPAPAR